MIAIVKVTLNLSLSRCMFFAYCSCNFHPIVIKKIQALVSSFTAPALKNSRKNIM